jgi:large repetitive protein
MNRSVRTALVALSTMLVAVSCGDNGDLTAPGNPISIQTASLAEAIEGQGYSQQLEAAGGSGAYSWVLAAGSLPSGLTLSPTGIISGTPVGPGGTSFRVRATDSSGRSATADLSIPVAQALAVHTRTLPDAEVGEDYAAQLQAVGGRGTLTWSLTGEAASWLTISPAGALSGKPVAWGTSTMTVAVADESGQQATGQLPIVIRAPLAVAAMSLPAATQGRAYASQLVATGGDGVYTWTLESGALPPGIALTTGGALTGMPSGGGEFTFAAQVTDGGGRVATRSLSVTVERAPTIQTGSLPPGDVGEPYAAQLDATGGTGAYSWSVIDGALPDGLTLSSTGAISGVPTRVGSSTFTARVTDEAAATHSRTFTIVIAPIEDMSNGVAVTGIGGDAGSTRYYAVEVPTGATQLTIATSGGTGDVDLYIRRGALPQEYVYDCRPFRPGNEEICTVASPAAGSWYIMLRGYAAYAGVRLVASHDG